MVTQLSTPEKATVSSVVAQIAHLLRGRGALSIGDASMLRRMDPRKPAAAFFKVGGLVLDDLLPGDSAKRVELETRWAAVIAGLAILGPLHEPSRRLGSVLAEAQFSELRFARVIRGDADRLVEELPALARFLAAKGAPVDWSWAAQLILSAGREDEEPVRRNVARDYFGALARLGR